MKSRALKSLFALWGCVLFNTSVAQQANLSTDSSLSQTEKSDVEYEALIKASERELRETRTNADILDDLFKPILEQSSIQKKQLERAAQFQHAEFVLICLLLVLVGIMVTLVIQLVQIRKRGLDQYKSERFINKLLKEILPEPIVEELVATGKVEPSIWTECLTVFIEVVHKNEYRSAEEKMVAVNASFLIVEKQFAKHGLIKIKSSGDKILAVHKITKVTPQQQIQSTTQALCKIKALIASENDLNVSIKAGIDQGDVISALVGQSKLRYDIWGHAVSNAYLLVEQALEDRVFCSGNVASQAASARIDYRSTNDSIRGKQEDIEVFEILC